MVKVFIKRCTSYDKADVAVASMLDELAPKLKHGAKVLLKPNVLTAAPVEKAVTTHPKIIVAVAKWFKQHYPDARLFLGDSSGSLGLAFTKKALKVTGMVEVAQAHGITTLPFEDEQHVKLKSPKAKMWKQITVAKIVKDADLIINLPKLKTHTLTIYTGAMKNLYGCIPGGLKGHGHMRAPTPNEFSELIVDVYDAIRPGINIMDAVIGMDGKGPGSGNPKPTGYILGSANAAALDLVATKLIGAKHIPQIETARARGLMPNAEVVGKFKVVKYKLPSMYKFALVRIIPRYFVNVLANASASQFMNEPHFNYKKCTQCYDCVRICPAKAIHIEKKYPVVDRSKCIKCMCCQEHCRYHAIDIKPSIFKRIFKMLKKVVE